MTAAGARRFRCGRGPLLALLAATGLAGCAEAPGPINPVVWYEAASDWIAGSGHYAAARKAAAEAPPIPGAGRPYPALSDVPERPRTSTAAERREAAARLAADRADARRAGAELRRRAEALARRAPGDAQ